MKINCVSNSVAKIAVKRFSDAPTDRDAVRKNAISYPAFERGPSSAATENSEFNKQESSSTRSVKEKGEARDYPRSVSQGSEKELLGQPESVLQSKDHGPGVEYRPEQNSGYYPGLARGNAPVVTNNTKASSGLDSAPKRQEMEEYNSKVREAKAQAAEFQRKNMEVQEHNAMAKQWNDQIIRMKNEELKARSYEQYQNRNRTIDNGSQVPPPYIQRTYRPRR
jgi:hypothetical protein